MKKLAFACTALALIVMAHNQTALHVAAQTRGNVVLDPVTYQDLRWRSIGPHRGGRSTAAVGVRTQPNVFYMGATGGGVWKTENYGATWTPITDGQIPTGSIGSIDVADSNPNVIYVGTGSEAIRSNVILGRGVFKSTDAGRTWQYAGLKEVGQIGQLKVDPRNPDVVFVASIGNPFGWGPDRGVYRTRDGGKTWQKVLFINDQTGVVSVAINWSNPNEIYAGAWRGQRQPWTIISGGPAAEGGVYKTTDGGDHWSRASTGFPDDLIGKVWVDIAQSNPKVVYAQVEAVGAKGGLYRIGRWRGNLDAGEQQPGAARASVLFQQGVREPEGRKRRLGHRAQPAPLHRRRKNIHHRPRSRTVTTTSSGSILTTRR